MPLPSALLLRLTAASGLRPAPRARSLLRRKEAELHTLAQALLKNETLTQAEIRSLLAGDAELPGSGGGGSDLLPVPEAPVPEAVPAPAAASMPVPPAA